MKKRLILFFLFLCILLSLAFFCFMPHKVSNAVIIKSTSKNTTVYINGNKKTIKVSNLKYPAYTVISYKHNLFKTYGVTVVKPMTNRILVKTNNKYEIESIGYIKLSKKVSYYKITDKGLEICKNNDLVIGKNNVKCFRDNHGNLLTFIISPMNYLNTRVGISNTNYSSLYHDKIQLTSKSSLKLYSLIDKSSQTIPPNTLISIDNNTEGMFVTINNKSKVYLNRLYLNGGDIKILSIKRGDSQENPEYSGTLEFSCSKKGICIVNELSIDDYLKKVVPSEMPSTASSEALKSQSVAARTCAIYDMLSNQFADMGFYVDDSTKSQVYNNEDENESTNSAIESTKGIIMTYNKLPIDTKYFSTSCGTGVRYEDVWFQPDGFSEAKPYYRTVNFISSISTLPTDEKGWLDFYKNLDYSTSDTASPFFRWNIKISQNALSRALNKSLNNIYNKDKYYLTIKKKNKILDKLPKLGNLKDIDILNRSRGGNITSIKFIFENASVTVKSDSYISDTLNFKKNYTGEDTYLQRFNSSTISNPSNIPSRFFSIEKVDKSYILYGGGYGHGVGMSQYGAMYLSKNNWKFNEILSVYYKNVDYVRLY